MMSVSACPICNTHFEIDQDGNPYNCPRCGDFRLAEETVEDVIPTIKDNKSRGLLSHYIRRMQSSQNPIPKVTSDHCNKILKQESLPTVKEQADNLIRWLGENSTEAGDQYGISDVSHGGIIGTVSKVSMIFILDSLKEKGLIHANITMSSSAATLTFEGWEYYQKLKLGVISSNKAFMAMKFGVEELDDMLNNYFRSAVKATGFKLERLDDNPEAGLIDDRLRVEIQSSRFIIADLTYDNNGAYWEAGYAEGLGKPVIYTCEASHFKTSQTHFDTNHHLTVVWDKEKPEEAVEKLKATIRATIPESTTQDPT